MQQCWYDPHLRPSAAQVFQSLAMLYHATPESEGTMDFESRWNAIRGTLQFGFYYSHMHKSALETVCEMGFVFYQLELGLLKRLLRSPFRTRL